MLRGVTIDDRFDLDLHEGQAPVVKLPWPMEEGWNKDTFEVEYDSSPEERCSFLAQQIGVIDASFVLSLV